MTRNAKVWAGITLFMVLGFNYAMFAIPLAKRSANVTERTKAIMISQVKSGKMFTASDDTYMLELFRKEKALVDKKLAILNALAATFAIIICSWTIFGVVVNRKK